LRFFPHFVCVVLAHLVPPATPKWKRRGSSARETCPKATSGKCDIRESGDELSYQKAAENLLDGFPVKAQKIRDRMRNLFSLLQIHANNKNQECKRGVFSAIHGNL